MGLLKIMWGFDQNNAECKEMAVYMWDIYRELTFSSIHFPNSRT